MRSFIFAVSLVSLFLIVQCQSKKPAADAPTGKQPTQVVEAEKVPEELPPPPEPVEETDPGEETPAPEETPEEGAESAEEATPVEEAKPVEEEKLAAAPNYNDLTQRSERVQEIYKLREAKDPNDMEKLKAVVTGDYLPFEKATAMRVLTVDMAKEMVDDLKKLAADDNRSVMSEAAILLYRAGEKEFALPILEDLVSKGLAVRRAFFISVKDGKYEYEPEAEEFFRKELEAEQVHVRLDGALGLLHLDHKKESLAKFREALDYAQPQNVRLTAVSYLASVRTLPEVQGLLEYAGKDPDPKVANRAMQILNPPMPGAAPPPTAE